MHLRYIVFLGLAAYLGFITPAFADTTDPDTWVRVKLDTHSTVQFPYIPEVLDSEGEYMLACSDSAYLYSAVVSRLPGELVSDSTFKGLQDLYRFLLARSIKMNSGHVTSIRNIMIDSTTGIICSYRVDSVVSEDLGRFRTKQFWYQNGKLYGLEFWSKDSTSETTLAQQDRFLSSFEWAELPEEREVDKESLFTAIQHSLKALIGGFVGVVALAFLAIRRTRRRRRTQNR